MTKWGTQKGLRQTMSKAVSAFARKYLQALFFICLMSFVRCNSMEDACRLGV